MNNARRIAIRCVDPRVAEIRRLVRELDDYMLGLYPAESNHLVDIETLARPEVRFFAAFVEDAALGCGAIMRREGARESEAYCEVKRIYVAPQGRGLGLGKLLLRHLEEETLAAGCRLMRLETGVHQPEALALFAAAGFAACGHFGDYPVDDPLSVFMEKRLSVPV